MAKEKSAPAAAAQDSKKQAINTAMQQIERMYGKGSIMRFGDGAELNVECIPTGSLGLDPSVRDYEPHMALDGGADGLDFYRNLAGEWKNALTVGGKIFLEVGIGQADDVLRLLRAQGFGDLEITKDLNGIPRVVHGTLWGEI